MRDQGEMNLVRSLLGADGRRRSPAKLLKRSRMSCVRQKRVVLTVVATVKPCGDESGLDRVSGIANSQGDGGQKELGSGESAHTPSTHRAGKAGCFPAHLLSRLRICVCKFFAQRIVGASRHPAFPAPSSPKEGQGESKTRALHAARMPICA
ncbi:hypothetical protein BD122_06460 [Bradyrhizobium diazoefficiens]|nr:hypothetical protein BD122_06460 [Bradyrhizobium diazoefficiens]